MYRYNKKYSLAYVFAHMPEPRAEIPDTIVSVDGDSIRMKSSRYHLMRHHSECQTCGLKGLYFLKEKQRIEHPYHFNLYGIDSRGNEILITREQVPSKSRKIICTKCAKHKRHIGSKQFKQRQKAINHNPNNI